MKNTAKLIILSLIFSSISCKENEKIILDNPSASCATENFFSDYTSKNFKMGFSTWSYAPTQEAVEGTYQFIENNSDIYSEHIDNKIPWQAWINDTALPTEFTNEIAGRASKRILNHELLVAVSLLNSDRSDLASDFDGKTPNYTTLNEQKIEDAYFKHIDYLLKELNPNYLVIAIEVNELKLKSETKWQEYKLLIKNVKRRIRVVYPDLKISESITLHNLYLVATPNAEDFITEVVNYANQMDFAAISYYPFFKGQHSKAEFQLAFDFLHSKITKPIAFVETSHIAENLSIPAFNFSSKSDECEQNAYLETLLENAQKQDYEFVIWWAHRDFDELWETFPEELKDLGKLWRDTGLLDENGKERVAYSTWKMVLDK